MPYSIRLATPDEAGIVSQQRRAMFSDMGFQEYLKAPNMDEIYTAWVRPRIANGTYLGWFAINIQGEIVGGVGLWVREGTPHPLDFSEQRGYVMNVYVHPDHRRQGIARSLMTVLLDWCLAHDLRSVYLHASESGRPLYSALGFEDSNEMRIFLR